MNPLAKAEGLVPTFTRVSDYPEVLPDKTIGCMTLQPATSWPNIFTQQGH